MKRLKIKKPVEVLKPMTLMPLFNVIEENGDYQIIEADDVNASILKDCCGGITEIEME